MTTDTTNALRECLAWHEREDKALSKSGRMDLDYHWRRDQHRLEIERITAALATAQPEAKPEGVDWPEVGSVWLHTNGTRYTVTGRANDESTRADYPPVVLYRGEDGRHWAKPLAEWHRSRTLAATRQAQGGGEDGR